MAGLRLTYRLAGMVAICLALVASPLDDVQRVAVLTAVAIGVAVTASVSLPEAWVRRALLPAIVVVAVVPVDGPGALVGLVALVALGVATGGGAGLARVVPASGLPVAALALRTGEAVDSRLIVAWVLAVAATLLIRAAAWPSTPGQSLGPPTPSRHPGIGSRQAVAAVAVLLIAGPVALQLAAAVGALVPAVAAAPQAGNPDGPRLDSHPGFDGGLDVGVPVDLPDEVVLRVRAERPHFWRARTYEEWDGRRWTSSLDPVAVESVDGRLELPPVGEPPVGAGGTDRSAMTIVTQQFRSERAGLDVLLGAWRVGSVSASIERALVASDGSIRLEEPLGAGASWTAVSAEVPATEADLRGADPLTVDGALEGVEAYATEDDVSEAVARLARDLTADAPTTYDKVRAIESWMDANLTYTRDIGVLSATGDAVDHLLFETRRGYCEQIGSALVVMLRSLGIPARLAVGYVPSSRDAATGEWISRASDAHTWAEVYFPGIGWRGFDPTAGVPTAADEPPASRLAAHPSPAGWALSAIAVLVGGAILGTPIIRSRVRSRSPGRRRRPRCALGFGRRGRPGATPGGRPVDRVLQLHQRLDRCGAQLPATWGSTMTVRDRAQSMVEWGVDPETVVAAVRAVERVTFGADADDGTDRLAVDAAEVAMDALEAAMVEPAVVSRATASRRGDTGRWPSARRRGRAPKRSPSRSPVR